MKPPHSKEFGFPRECSLQRESAIRRNRDLRGRKFEVDQTLRTWKNEPSITCKEVFQQKPSRRGLHGIRTAYSEPSNLQRTSSIENGRQGIEPRVPLERTCRNHSEDFFKEIFFKELMRITKGWNFNRKFRILEERESRITDNVAII
ncbi:hypothetical protein O181_019120 [Austropuccinia psidii MF-1]|uniref:Uncharacterized protein n=1 Tax=Austropuccinia psidii MF-1 TaxID=1389203 RepID=A0A9Q3C9Z5_9BASI|nr:hypothetical protein [Austropuccinia psidii MF-1]